MARSRKRRHPAVQAYIQEITSQGGRARAAKLTAQRRRQIAVKGGQAAWKGISREERSERMRAVIRARWARQRAQSGAKQARKRPARPSD